MATVYLADDLKHGRKVAVKVLRPELAAALGPDRFPREVRILASLQQVLVGWQDIYTDGSNKVDLRPAAGGSSRTLAAPKGHSAIPFAFSADDKSAIVLSGTNGNVLQRFSVPQRKEPAKAN